MDKKVKYCLGLQHGANIGYVLLILCIAWCPETFSQSVSSPEIDQKNTWWGSLQDAVGTIEGDLTPRLIFEEGDQTDQISEHSAERADDAAVEPGATIDPGALNPNTHPEVASNIREWLSVAEPPENATDGAKLRYNEWGVKLGSVAGGIIKGTPGKPDDVGVRTSSEYLWGLRSKLDSVDHCTLEEFVMIRLEDKSTSHCAGRYQPLVVDLVGKTKSTAEKLINQRRLKPRVLPGDPAPSRNMNGKIQRQEPASGTSLERGQTVTIWVHSPYINIRNIPDLIGLSSNEARSLLSELDLEVKLHPGSPAPDSGKFGKVEQQKPLAGSKVKPGTIVDIFVYAPHTAQIEVPNVIGFTVNEARSQLEDTGLAMAEENAGRPSARWQAGSIKQQTPESGTLVNTGTLVTIQVFSAYTSSPEEQIAAHDCSQWPGSKAFWDNKENKPYCDCPNGFKQNKNKTACVNYQVAAKEHCSQWPNSIPVWTTDTKYECKCPDGWTGNRDQTACVQMAQTDTQSADTAAAIFGSLLGGIAAMQEEKQARRNRQQSSSNASGGRPSSAFADSVLAYNTGSRSPEDRFRNAREALGSPNWDGVNFGRGFVSLGCGGALTLSFSGGRNMNVASVRIHEIGSAVEPTRIDVQTQRGWQRLGNVSGSTDTITLRSPQPLAAVRLTDLQRNCGDRTPGADIDAVELIGSSVQGSGAGGRTGCNCSVDTSLASGSNWVCDSFIERSKYTLIWHPINASLWAQGYKPPSHWINGGYHQDCQRMVREFYDSCSTIKQQSSCE